MGLAMPGNKNFFDALYNETMSEMAENFFGRRRDIEARLEGFARIALEVRTLGVRAIRRWKTVITLLVDEAAVQDFCSQAGIDASGVPALAAAEDCWRFRLPLALTRSGRYRKSVRYAYQAMRQATLDYLEGAYGTDPGNPLRKIQLPNYAMVKDLAETINAEVSAVNCCQSPSSVLAYAKSLDPAALDRENVAGGFTGEDMGKIDRDLCFTPVNFAALALPALPKPPPLEEVRSRLDALSATMFDLRREDVLAAMAMVSAR